MSHLSPRPEELWFNRWKIMRWVLVLAVLFGAIPGFYAFEAARGRSAWRTYEQEATRRGVKLKFSEFIPPVVPDAENFASIPIFEEAFRDFNPRDYRAKPLSLDIGLPPSALPLSRSAGKRFAGRTPAPFDPGARRPHPGSAHRRAVGARRSCCGCR